jgi:hypothetical protein
MGLELQRKEVKCEGYKTQRRWLQEDYWISKLQGTTGGNRIRVIEIDTRRKRAHTDKKKTGRIKELIFI